MRWVPSPAPDALAMLEINNAPESFAVFVRRTRRFINVCSQTCLLSKRSSDGCARTAPPLQTRLWVYETVRAWGEGGGRVEVCPGGRARQ